MQHRAPPASLGSLSEAETLGLGDCRSLEEVLSVRRRALFALTVHDGTWRNSFTHPVHVGPAESGLPNRVLEKSAENSAFSLALLQIESWDVPKKAALCGISARSEKHSLSCRLNGRNPDRVPGAQLVSVYSGVISITQGGLPESAGAIRRLDVDPSQSAYEVYGATFYGPGARKSNRPPSLAPDIPLCTYSAPEVGVRCSRHLPRDGDHSGCRQTLSSSRVQRV